MSSEPTGSPSLVRTGARAGAAFVGSVAKGVFFGALLGGGAFFYYVSQLSGPGMPGARAGGAGALLALLFSPPLLVAVLLALFMGVYVILGVSQGRTRAMRHLVAARGEAVAQRLGDAIAGRIESMPRTHGALRRASDWLSVDALSAQLAPVLGDGKAVRAVIAFVLNRLPLNEMLAEWQQGRAAQGEPQLPVAQGGAAPAQDPALRALITRRIHETLQEMSTPSRKPFWIVLALHAALFGTGLWLVS
ncbi:hypothetical protein [Variovorax sp. UC122_21]|uniref:hypothetical protein n=1 Tax=Variovorax TaxID=34072 RepID=UPI0019322C29|nr:hypothetical protein INQ48_30645 [Variovorax paradoxus]